MKKRKLFKELPAALRQVDANAGSQRGHRLCLAQPVWSMVIAESRRLQQLKEENLKLKQLGVDLTLNKVIL